MATEAQPNVSSNSGWSEAQVSEARERAEACGREVMDVLARYACQIVPFIANCEPVGHDGRKAMISTSYGIIPNAVPATSDEEASSETATEAD